MGIEKDKEERDIHSLQHQRRQSEVWKSFDIQITRREEIEKLNQ